LVAVSLTAWLGGLGPALLTIALSLVSTHYFVLPPASLFALTFIELLQLGAFVAVAGLIGVLSSALREASARFHVTLASIGDGVIASDSEGRVTFMNPVAEALTGWSVHEAVGKELSVVFHIVNMHTREPVGSPVAKVLREGTVVGLANHTLLIAKDGTERPRLCSTPF
jgi:PAS domain S-box-containing protein